MFIHIFYIALAIPLTLIKTQAADVDHDHLIAFPHAHACAAEIRKKNTPPLGPKDFDYSEDVSMMEHEPSLMEQEFIHFLGSKKCYVFPSSAMFCGAASAHWHGIRGEGSNILIVEPRSGLPNDVLSAHIRWLITDDPKEDHAPHVAGIAFQIAPRSNIKVITTETVSAAILGSNHVINCSWCQEDTLNTGEFISGKSLLRSYLGHPTIMVVFAAGNDGSAFEYLENKKRINMQALTDRQLSNMVFALNAKRNSSLCASSNYPGISGKKFIEHCITALGTDVFSAVCGKGFAKKTGTSMATPTVSGALALLRSAYPNKTAKWYKECLIESAEKDFFVCYDADTGVFVYSTEKLAPSERTLKHLNRFGFFTTQPFKTVATIYGSGILSVNNMLLYAQFKSLFPTYPSERITTKIRKYKSIMQKHALSMINDFIKKNITQWRVNHPKKQESTCWADDDDEWQKIAVVAQQKPDSEVYTRYIWALMHRFFSLADMIVKYEGWQFYTTASKKLSTWELCIEENDADMASCLARHPIPTNGSFPRHLVKRAQELQRPKIIKALSDAIIHSMDKNDSKTFATLAEAGFDSHETDKFGRHSIQAAIDMHEINALKVLCLRSPHVNTLMQDGTLPWKWVLENNMPEIFAKFLKNPNFLMTYQAACTAVRSIPKKDRMAFQEAINQAIQLREKDQYGRYPLHAAIFLKNIPLVTKIAGNDNFGFNLPGPDGIVPWVWAIENGHSEVFKVMAQTAGPRIYSWISPHGDRPLHVATKNGLFSVVEFMLENGAHLNSHNRNGFTAHQIAQRSKKKALLELFNEHRSYSHF